MPTERHPTCPDWQELSGTEGAIDQPVLVWCRADAYTEPQMHVAKFNRGEWQLQDEHGSWLWSGRLYSAFDGECLITHWMKLPNPPPRKSDLWLPDGSVTLTRRLSR